MKKLVVALLAVAMAAYVGAGGPGHRPTAKAAAQSIMRAVPKVAGLVEVTERNDPEQLLGQPSGYLAATVLVDARMRCPLGDLGVQCGAVVEQWPGTGTARRRYNQVMGSRYDALDGGSERLTMRGDLLLIVSDKLSPTAAQNYRAAFTRSCAEVLHCGP
jgi:hypothetical protein